MDLLIVVFAGAAYLAVLEHNHRKDWAELVQWIERAEK